MLITLATTVLIIAHRGASGERPEHTLAAYALAIEQGADFIEPDLVPTKDGVLVARHENEISGTTNVASRPEFAARKTTKTIDGETVTGWFTEDFTLAELKTLRARERLPQLRSTAFDGQYQVPTFAEVLALAKAKGVGVYPETKHPAYFEGLGLSFDGPLLAELRKVGWTKKSDPVFIQSFEDGNLIRLSKLTKLRLVQLVAPDQAARLTPAGLKLVASYAAGVGPEKSLVIPRGPDGRLGVPTDLVARARALGLAVHPWTFRRENFFLPAGLKRGDDPRAAGDLGGEVCMFLKAGVDGVFSDNVAEAVAAKRGCQTKR
jgi:glycerophosphoryl diester phosphodiesterase